MHVVSFFFLFSVGSMKHLVLLGFLFCLAFAASDVVVVTDKNWKAEVVESGIPVLVKFYAPW